MRTDAACPAAAPTAYEFGPLVLASNCPLPELPAAALMREPDWTFRLEPARSARRAGPWFHRTSLPDGRRWRSVARRDGGYLLRFHGLADFDLDTGARRIACHPAPATAAASIRHLLLDQVLPLLVSGGRRVALHASAVCRDGRTVALLGPAGAGKSTLAVGLARRGWELLGDDCLLVETGPSGVIVRPAYPGARLHADSLRLLAPRERTSTRPVAQYTRKRRIDLARAGLPFSRTPSPLAGACVLTPRQARSRRVPHARLLPLTRGEGMVELLRFTFHLDVEHRQAVADRFEVAGAVARAVPIARLIFPFDFRRLDETCRLLETLAER